MADNAIRKAALDRKPPVETMVVPEWGDAKIEVRGMGLGEQQRFLKSLPDPDAPSRNEKMTVQLIIRTVYDPDTGTPVFDPADASELAAADPAPFSRVFRVAARLSGLTSTEEVEAELAADPTEDSSSD